MLAEKTGIGSVPSGAAEILTMVGPVGHRPQTTLLLTRGAARRGGGIPRRRTVVAGQLA
jgi:hypothetical protein